MIRRLALSILLFAALIASMSCGGAGTGTPNFLAYVLVNPTSLGAVNLLTGDPLGGPVTLSSGNIRNIAVRPTDGQLFGLGSDFKLYSINPATGACTVVNAVAMGIDDHNGGMTFEPNSNTIRYVSVTGSNYRINSATGSLTATDTTANAQIVGLAVRRTDGRYFGYTTSDTVVSTLNPSGGVYSSVGPSGVNASGLAGMAIDNDQGMAYFVAAEGLFTVSLNTGAINLMDATPYMDIAVAEL